MVPDLALPAADGASATPVVDARLPMGLVERQNGIHVDLGLPTSTRTAAVSQLFGAGFCLAGLDYPMLIKALYDVGPGPSLGPGSVGSGATARVAGAVRRIEPARLALYKPPKMGRGYAEYYFEPLYLDEEVLADGTVLPERLAQLDVDEFIAVMWTRAIRFGIDIAAVMAAIGAARAERITFATDLAPEPGVDATVIEVSTALHRSDAPRARADGRVDLQSFENRFPQIQAGVRLLKKIPASAGLPGYDMAGRVTPPAPPRDLLLRTLAGEGTEACEGDDGEYLVATREGFLSVDAKSGRIAITDKIISLDGVSGRTTGNLELAGAYEEYGDVQEQRDVTGSDITVHGNVYGHIHSRGGVVALERNLVGGSVHNAAGPVTVKGVASNAVIRADGGAVTVARAENCVISGASIHIGAASNCEIVGDVVQIGLAEGCAVAGRNVEVESAGPRRRTEMVIYVLLHELGRFDRELDELDLRLAGLAQVLAGYEQEAARIAALPDVRRYLALSHKLRSQELTVTVEQAHFLRKIAASVANEMGALDRLRKDGQIASTQQKLLQQRQQRVLEEKVAAAGVARCGLHLVSGETVVRAVPATLLAAGAGAGIVHAAGATAAGAASGGAGAAAAQHARELRQRLRAAPTAGTVLFQGNAGALDWHIDARQRHAPASAPAPV